MKKRLFSILLSLVMTLAISLTITPMVTEPAMADTSCDHNLIKIIEKRDNNINRSKSGEHGWQESTSPDGKLAYDICNMYGGATGENWITMSIENNPEEITIPVNWNHGNVFSAYGKFMISFRLDGTTIKSYDFRNNADFSGWKTEYITIPAGNHTLTFVVNKTSDGSWAGGMGHSLEVPKISAFVNSKCTICGKRCYHESFNQNYDTAHHWLECKDEDGCQMEIVGSREEHEYDENGNCKKCSYSKLETETEGGVQYYKIGTPQQLLSFSNLVKNEQTDINAKITGDINMMGISSFEPIGTDMHPYTGIIDGQGHRIMNLNVNLPDSKYVGFLGATRGAVTKNLVIDKTCTFIGKRLVAPFGVRAGNGGNSSNINCGFEGTAIAKEEEVTGMVINGDGWSFTNCYCTGKVIAENGTAVAGISNACAWVTYTDCYFAGELYANGNRIPGKFYWRNDYYVTDEAIAYSQSHCFTSGDAALTDGTLLADISGGGAFIQGPAYPILYPEPEPITENHDHQYLITYEWLNDGEQCKATAVCITPGCAMDGRYVEETVDAEIWRSGIVEDSTIGIFKYNAIFENELFENQEKEFYISGGATGSAHRGSHKGWTKWGDKAIEKKSLPSSDGKYYLTSDVTMYETWDLPSGTTTLCLNGHTIKGSTQIDTLFNIASGEALVIDDCANTEHEGYIDSNNVWHLGTSQNNDTEKPIHGGIITAGKDSAIVIEEGGKCSLYSGTIAGNQAYQGGAIHVDGIFDMHGGDICYNLAKGNGLNEGNGGGIYTAGTFNMYGGTIKGNTANKLGGGVTAADDNAVINILGGSIENNNAGRNGGGVAIHKGSFSMKDANIIGNKSVNGGDQLFGTAANSPSCTLSGACTVDIEDINDGNILDVEPNTTNLDETTIFLDKQDGMGGTSSAIGTYGGTLATVTVPTKEGYSFAGYYDASSGGHKYYNTDGTAAKAWHKIRARATLYARWVEQMDDIVGTDGLNALKGDFYNTSGKYRLQQDYTLTDDVINIASNANIVLDLNGHYIRMAGSANVFNVKGTFKIVNTSPDDGAIERDINSRNRNDLQSLIYVSDGGSLTVEPGTGNVNIQNNTSSAAGAGIYVQSGTVDIYDKTQIQNCITNSTTSGGGGVCLLNGTLNMHGGLFKECKTTGTVSGTGMGGAIYAEGTSTVINMSGGSIENCTAQRYGGGINAKGTFNMSGGSITNCTAIANGGGGVYSDGTINITGGTITGNTANLDGKQIRSANNNATIKDYCTIDTGNDYLSGVTNEGTKSKITFAKQGGVGGTSSVDPTTWQGTMPEATMPTRRGYTFLGYYDASAGGTKYYNANGTSAKNWDKIVADTKLYAHWSVIKYYFHFDTNGGIGGGTTKEVLYDQDMPTISMPTRPGYIFNGYWFNDERIYDEKALPLHEKNDYDSDMTLLACWERAEEKQSETFVAENLPTTEKQKAESIKDQIDVKVTDDNGERILEQIFEREEGDVYSHKLYYKTTIIGATEDTVMLDIKPFDQPQEHDEDIGTETEMNVEEGKMLKMRIEVPEYMQDESWLYIRHIKEDGTTYYDVVAPRRGGVTFENTHGFSEFDISTNEFGDPEFSGKSLHLGESIGATLYMTIPEEYLGGTMYYSISGRGSCTESTQGEWSEKNDRYKFVCDVNALQMADKIKATYEKGDYKIIKEYSIVDYINESLVEGSTKMKNLAKKLYSYGYYAQHFLSGTNEFELGEGDDKYAEMDAPDAAPDTSVDLSKYALSVSDNGNTEISGEPTKALTLDSEISLKLFVPLSEDASYDEDNKPVVKIDGEELDSDNISFNSGQMVITVKGITAGRLGHTFKVVVDGNYTIKASALSYAYSLLQSEVDYAKELGAAIYEYYVATMNYVELPIE